MDIIERVYKYDNQMMLDRCLLLKRVVSQTREIKIGRGKNVSVIKRPKYDVESETIQRINNSVVHYKKLIDNE